MGPISAISSVGNLLSVPIINKYSEVLVNLHESYLRSKKLGAEHGVLVRFFLTFFFPDAAFVMDRVERYMLDTDDQHVIAFLESYTSSFNMIGVAVAIIAQVAISAISILGVEDPDWAIEALFIASLVTGCLSVFFSCATSPAFHGLHSAEDIKDFLTKPANTREFNESASELNNSLKRDLKGLNEMEIADFIQAAEDLKQRVERARQMQRWKIASPYAAILLVVPMTLLNISLNTLLMGLGLYTAQLVPTRGFESIGIVVIYLVSALFGIMYHYAPLNLKLLEAAPLKRWRRAWEDFEREVKIYAREGAPNGEDNRGRLPRFRQSRHTREGSGVRFTIEDENVHHVANPNELHFAERPIISIEGDSLPLTEEQGPPNPPRTSHPVGASEAAGTSPGNIQDILKGLIQSHEEILRLEQRLLQAFST
ncbi:hypothetical protein GGR51DRAFT_531374 [Nemania sp. FL0031]|nr:hypothetical protein GGR51DRAFT_531374 [Nemania sp. FL0031]